MPAQGEDERIDQLIEAILRAASGNFDSCLAPSSRRDEIDAVIVGFNAMASRLADLYANLDQQVAERTELLESARAELERLAYSDTLTGLANRAELNRQLAARADAIRRGEPNNALFVLDLDRFKEINDTHGHPVGDQVLRGIAQRLQQSVRDCDVAARLGGDEFALLAQVDADQADRLADRLLGKLDRPMDCDGVVVHPGVSIGYTMCEPGGEAADWLLQADTAMYVAKRGIHGKTQRFYPYMLSDRQGKAQLINDLRTALRSGQIRAAYQPIVEVESGKVVAVEALARWNHPERGTISPAEFLPLAKESGQLPDLRALMLAHALGDLRNWRRAQEVSDDFRVHVNINPFALCEPDLVETILATLDFYGLPPRCLVIEVTEDRYISDGQIELHTLKKFQQVGIGVHIDDFGAGYSSFGYLPRLPLDGVKIDRSITMDLESDSRQCSVLRAIVDLTEACGLSCVAEGIETAGQREILRDLGIRYAQGYYFGRPGKFPLND